MKKRRLKTMLSITFAGILSLSFTFNSLAFIRNPNTVTQYTYIDDEATKTAEIFADSLNKNIDLTNYKAYGFEDAITHAEINPRLQDKNKIKALKLGTYSFEERDKIEAFAEKEVGYMWDVSDQMVWAKYLSPIEKERQAFDLLADEDTKKLDAVVQEFLNSFDYKNATPLEKIDRIHKFLRARWTYDYADGYNQNAYDALVNGKSVCAGYAKAAALLGKIVGLDTDYRYTSKESGAGHAKCIIKVGDRKYYLDTGSFYDEYNSSNYDDNIFCSWKEDLGEHRNSL